MGIGARWPLCQLGQPCARRGVYRRRPREGHVVLTARGATAGHNRGPRADCRVGFGVGRRLLGVLGAAGDRQFVVGTGGRELRPFDEVRPNGRARGANALGVLKLTLGTRAYDWKFAPVAEPRPWWGCPRAEAVTLRRIETTLPDAGGKRRIRRPPPRQLSEGTRGQAGRGSRSGRLPARAARGFSRRGLRDTFQRTVPTGGRSCPIARK